MLAGKIKSTDIEFSHDFLSDKLVRKHSNLSSLSKCDHDTKLTYNALNKIIFFNINQVRENKWMLVFY